MSTPLTSKVSGSLTGFKCVIHRRGPELECKKIDVQTHVKIHR